MGDDNHRIPEEWLSRIGGRDSSGWLAAFVESPQRAVADLLWDEFYFGPLNLIDRRQIVTTWLDVLRNVQSFADTLDREFAAWVKENWGRFDHTAEEMASAWSCLCNIVEISANLLDESALRTCAHDLREHFDLHRQFLGSFSTAPAADPLGAYLAAVAEFQGDDRSLAPFWHDLCELPDGVPFYHARYAMLGLRRIRSAEPSVNGTLRPEVVRGLLNLAKSFDRLAIEGKLEIDLARDTFRRIARQTEAAYRDSPGWALYGVRAALELSDRAQGWLTIVPSLGSAMQKERERVQKGLHRSRQSIEADPNWSHTAREIGRQLRSRNPTYVPNAKKLLNEQRRYAEATGDRYYVVLSLLNFASGVHRFNPQLALRWAAEALQWDPHNHYSWTIIRTVLLVQNRVKEASQFAWVAWKRFPEDVAVYNALADVLNVSRRHAEAEFIYRQAIERFPNDIRVRNGLAATLGRLGKLAENEEEYRRTIKAGLADVATFVGLAQLLLAKGDRAEAMAHIERALELHPNNIYAQNLQRKLESRTEPSLDQVDDWSQIPDVLSELSTFPMIKSDQASLEWEPEETLIEMSKEQPHSLDERISENEIERQIEVAPERETEVAPKQKTEASTEQGTEVAPEQETKVAPEQETKASTERDTKAVIEQRAEAANFRSVGARVTQGAERFEIRAAGDELKPYQFKPARAIVIAALVSEAYFYRTWARTVGGKLSAKLRKIALNVLDQAEELSPENAEILTEKAALIADGGNLTLAREKLNATFENHPGVVSVLMLRARMDREIAREEKRRLSEATLEELCVMPQLLREREPGLSPLFHYQKGLAALALLDGDDRKRAAADSFSSFRRKLNHLAEAKRNAREASGEHKGTETGGFYIWLEEHVNRQVFEGLPEVNKVTLADIAFLDTHWNERRLAIEEIEDVFASRLTLGAVSAELVSTWVA